MEFILLCALPAIITTQMPSLQTDSLNTAIVTVLSVLLLIPIPLVICYGFMSVHKGWKGYSESQRTLAGLDGLAHDEETGNSNAKVELSFESSCNRHGSGSTVFLSKINLLMTMSSMF